jgi:signal transduction histidine kinase
MRNPLSAIVQCADSISTSMAELHNSPNTTLDPAITATVKSCIEAAETIQLCAQHQKSIVDDILTISKLDSNLLLITPVPIQPIKVIQQALKMFSAECAMTNITMNLHIETSVKDLSVDWVMLDSSRLLQILINLLTNAIKFTKSEESRFIGVSIAASLEPPADGIANFRYFPTNKARADVTAGEDWGSGEILYLRFEVRDTGCGLNESEKKNLFTRFSQASPRTHVQYGGSGLGLFISRQLTELQGGEIGVASEAGKGSTFAFYLKSRRSEAQHSATLQLKLNSDLESSARLATNVARSLRDDEGSIVSLLTRKMFLIYHYFKVSGALTPDL